MIQQNTLWKKVHWTDKVQHSTKFCVTVCRWERTDSCKNSWWYIMVISTGKGRKGSKNKGATKCIWSLWSYKWQDTYVQCYKRKTAKQFADFLKRVDKRYDKNIQNIFVILDNLSVHKSKRVQKEISKYCQRIKFVFLPVRSPKLNLIEVRWVWLQRQAINNSTFKDEQEIGRAVSKWKDIYNKNHGKANTTILQEYVPLCLQSC